MPFVDQLSLLLALLLLQALADGCPAEVCICKWKGGKQTVECGGQSLPNIPEGMDPGTQVLNFSGNALQVLQSERFLRMDLLNLQKIYLSRNQLIRIHEKAFRGLTNLVELDLAENALQHIPSETFQDYSSLMRLSLSGNPIRELKTSAFRYLSFLTTLELSNCQIERIENEAFVGMDNLEWLRLDGNRISFIQGNYILPKSLHGISLQMNRWTCDCRLLDLHLWLISYNTPQTEEPKCVEPPRLKGQIIKSLKRPQLACLPEVTPQSTYTEVSEGRNLSISCLVRAIPEPKVLWLFNGQVMTNDSLLDNLHLYYYIDESPGLAEEKRSEIFIYNVGVEDNGTFSCVGKNVAGTTFSNYTIRVIIKDPPVVNEVSFPQNYMNCIVASSAGGGLIFLVLLCTVIIKCKQREVAGKRKKCSVSAVTSVNGTNTSSSDGSSSNDTGLMKCSSILNDGDSINANSGLILSACDGMTPTKLSKENGVILGNHMKQNIMLYAPLDGSNQTLQLSVNLTSAAATLASNSSNTPPPLLPPSLMVNPAISNSLAYCSPPASLRNYVEKNPDLVNDAESGVKNKLKVSASLDASASEYDAASDCSSVPVQYDQFYQLAPHFGSQIMRPNLTTAAAVANSHFAAMTTLPRGIQLKTVMNSLPPNPVDVHLNPVCFLGQNGFAFDYSNSHLQQSPGPMAPAHHHLIHQTSHQQPLTNIQQQQPHHQQQNFYRTLPHNKTHKQQQQQQQQQQHFNGSPAATIELLQQHTATSNYEKFAIPNIRCTAEGYPKQSQLVQYPSPPEGYKSSPPRSNNDETYVGLQQWPPCLPGYHAQGILYPSTLAATAPTAIYTTNIIQAQQQNATNTVASSAGGNNGGGDDDDGGDGGSSGGAMHLQTVNLTKRSDLSAALKVSPLTNQALPSETITPPTTATAAVTQSIISTQNDGRKSVRCIAGQVDASTITPECKESDIAPTPNSGDAIRLATLPEGSELLPPATATEQSIKQRHLNGPLADSPDEGYVGDSHESTDM